MDVRDAVKRAARNLAGKGAEYGVRLEIPNHMKTAMGALQSASFELKQKFPGARRNVLFDDDSMELVLDFSVSEGKPWKRMTTAQARERKKKRRPAAEGRTGLNKSEIDALLDKTLEEEEPDEHP